jgi:hypothetical protein
MLQIFDPNQGHLVILILSHDHPFLSHCGMVA